VARVTLSTVVRLACNRCKASAERPPSDSRDGGLEGWRWVLDWPDGDHVSDEATHLCPACAERFAWFMAGGPVLDEIDR
jgi:hypothetical protein